MPAQLTAYLWVALAAPFLLLALIAFALVRRYHERAIPSWAKWSGAFLTGFCVSAVFIIDEDPLWFILPSLPVIWVAYLMARSGRFRLAGLMALGLTLPAAVYWASLLLADAANPAPLFGPGLNLRFLTVAAGVVTGIGLVVIGDHVEQRPRIVKQPAGTTRDPMALGNAMAADLLIGPFSLPSLTAELTAFLVTSAALTVAVLAGVPWPFTLLGGALLFMVIATELWYRAFPQRSRMAWVGYAYVGHQEMERWRAATGTQPPASVKAFHAWLRDNAERPETRWAHAELLAVVGRLDEARAMAQRIEANTPAEENERQSMMQFIEWIDGQDVDLDDRLRQADLVGEPGSDARLYARGLATLALARDRAQADGDWKSPLVAFGQEVGATGWAAWRADTHRRRMISTLLVGLLIASLAAIPIALAGTTS
ncbi:MAG TPA: hypothetical protein VJY85_10790 [Candidatus Limnocylindria bacterium]|nr:hypothetical protein [Candidatus Limnocylindria bacterium]